MSREEKKKGKGRGIYREKEERFFLAGSGCLDLGKRKGKGNYQGKRGKGRRKQGQGL